MISCTTDGHVEISFVRTWYILASALQFALLKDTENYEKIISSLAREPFVVKLVVIFSSW